jgi:hypothetical protein
MLALPETVQCRSLYINTLPVIFCSSDECKSFGSSSLLLKRVCPICISCFQRFSSSRVPASAWRGAPLASTRADHSYARQESDGDCSSSDTCSQCYGPGNVICSYISCFNPSQHEQCCGDGSEFSPFQAAPNLGTTKKVIKIPSGDMLTRYSPQATVSRPTIVAVVLW